LATPVWVLIVLTFVQGAGMANVVPPTTESIMSSLPPQKAGVGSAVSNTIRQVGGALGVAILGSVLSGLYRGQMTDGVAGLPEAARGPAGESISGAYGVAAKLGPAGGSLINTANDAFVSAMHWAAGASALVGFLSIFVALAWLPRQANPHHAAPAPTAEPALELAEQR
jgi:MFS transporter, DHA2 family, multidrug resistance protein